ncbi:hypothetical protein R6Q59_004275, partial [Mikania micrantha]
MPAQTVCANKEEEGFRRTKENGLPEITGKKMSLERCRWMRDSRRGKRKSWGWRRVQDTFANDMEVQSGDQAGYNGRGTMGDDIVAPQGLNEEIEKTIQVAESVGIHLTNHEKEVGDLILEEDDKDRIVDVTFYLRVAY